MAEGLGGLDPLMLEALGLELDNDADPALLAAAAHAVERDREEIQRRRTEYRDLQNPERQARERSTDQSALVVSPNEVVVGEIVDEGESVATDENNNADEAEFEFTNPDQGDRAQEGGGAPPNQPPRPPEVTPAGEAGDGSEQPGGQETTEASNLRPEVVQILEQLGVRVEQLPSGNGAFNFISGNNNQQAAVIINQGVQARDLADLLRQFQPAPVFAAGPGVYTPNPTVAPAQAAPATPGAAPQPGGAPPAPAPQEAAQAAQPAQEPAANPDEGAPAGPEPAQQEAQVGEPANQAADQEPAQQEAQPNQAQPVAAARQPEVRIIGNPETQEDYEQLTIDYFNRLAQQTERNFTDRHGRGLTGAFRRMRSWFSRVGARQESQTLDEAGRYQENRTKWRKWAKIGLKVLGGAGLAAATVLSGGAAGSLAAFKLLGVSLAPAAYTVGLKTGIDGLMEGYQQLKWGNERINEQLDKQVEVSVAMDRLRNAVREGRINQASFANHVQEIWRLHSEAQVKESEYWTEQQKARQKRLWGSSAAAFGLAFLGGIPVGVGGEGTPPYKGEQMFTELGAGQKVPGFENAPKSLQDFLLNREQTYSVLNSAVSERGVLYQPFQNIINGDVTSWENFMKGEFFYNTTTNEVVEAVRIAKEKSLLLNGVEGFWGLETHSLGHGIGLAERKGLLAALGALVGLNILPAPKEAERLLNVEQRAERQAERPLPDRYIEPNETPTIPAQDGSGTRDQNPPAPTSPTPPPPPEQPQQRRRGLWQRFLDLFRRNPENRQ